MKAVSLLAQSGRNAVPPLVDLIYSADDPATVNLAIDALTKIGPPILAEVYQELQEDMDENYRAVFLRLVGEVGDVHSLLKISHFYLDPSERIAGEALRSTCKIGGPAAAAKALEVFALRSFSEEFVKARMFDFGAYKLKGVVEALVAFFDGKGVFAKYTNSDIKAMAARTLGQIGGPEAVAGLCNVLTAKKGFLGFGKGDEKLEAAACTALGMIGDPTAEAALQKAAQSKFDAVRSAAELALKALKKKSAGTAGTAATVAAAPTKVAEARTFAKAAPDASTQVAPPPAQAPTVIAGPPPGTQRVRIYLTVGQMILDNVRVAIAGVDETGKPTANQLGADFDLKPGEYDVVIRDEGFSITKKIKVEDQPAEFRFDLQSAFNF
jgi:HEAT repeat protein